MKVVNKAFDKFFEKIIAEHLQSKDEERPKDFVDATVALMFSEESDYRIERSDIKAILVVSMHKTYIIAYGDLVLH